MSLSSNMIRVLTNSQHVNGGFLNRDGRTIKALWRRNLIKNIRFDKATHQWKFNKTPQGVGLTRILKSDPWIHYHLLTGLHTHHK